jgi:hypothetical protein
MREFSPKFLMTLISTADCVRLFHTVHLNLARVCRNGCAMIADSGHFVEELLPCADPSMCQKPQLCLLWVELYGKESVAGPVPA